MMNSKSFMDINIDTEIYTKFFRPFPQASYLIATY